MRTRRWIRECRARRSRPSAPAPWTLVFHPCASAPWTPGLTGSPSSRLFAPKKDADLLPRKQYCVFRAGRERFCFAVLDVEEVIEWPKVTAVPLASAISDGNIQPAWPDHSGDRYRPDRIAAPDFSPKFVVVACLRGQDGASELRLGVAADEVFGAVTTSRASAAGRGSARRALLLRHAARRGAAGVGSGFEEVDRELSGSGDLG